MRSRDLWREIAANFVIVCSAAFAVIGNGVSFARNKGTVVIPSRLVAASVLVVALIALIDYAYVSAFKRGYEKRGQG